MLGFRKGSLALASVIAASTMMSGANAEEVTTLRWASFVSPMSMNNRVSVPAYIKEIEAASEGALKIELFAGGTLGSSPAQQLTMVENGVADIAEVVVAYSPGRFAELSTFELPSLAQTNVEGGLAAYSMYEKGLLSDFDDLMLVGIILSGPYALSANRPITSLEDIKGLRIRAAGPIQNEIVEALGGVPVGNIAAPAIAENISRGLLDGALMAPGNLINFRIADAAFHHMLDLQLGSVAVIFPMRRDTYAKLGPKAKAAFDTYSGAWLSRVLAEGNDIQTKETIDKLSADPKHTIYTWSEAELAKANAAMADVTAKYDVANDKGVNLYREALTAIEAVRAGN